MVFNHENASFFITAFSRNENEHKGTETSSKSAVKEDRFIYTNQICPPFSYSRN